LDGLNKNHIFAPLLTPVLEIPTLPLTAIKVYGMVLAACPGQAAERWRKGIATNITIFASDLLELKDFYTG
jgi:hypothetical protein